MQAVARIIIGAIEARDDASVQGRLAGQVRDIVERFPVPGLRDA
jgi:hypothetical protein